jgi:catechol 2,3-dioxygenase-like lactoylglutathione lyase family enzyme
VGDARIVSAMNRNVISSLCWLAIGCAAFAQGVSRPAITGLSHVTLYADDLAKSQQFYAGLLGWEQVPAGVAQPGVRFYANHAQYVELLPAPSKGLADRLNSIGFSTSNAELLRSFLNAHGVAVPATISVDGNGDAFFDVRDPEGNVVEFRQTGPNPPKSGRAVNERVSTHIIHAGFVAHDRAKLDSFYKDLLGFHLYWEGGSGPGHTDWVMMQVPNGTDWLEYMLYLPSNAPRAELGSANHFAPGVESVTALDKRLRARGWVPTPREKPPLLGVDGKWQLDLYDPDGTRAEFMEFVPVKKACCSKYTGKQPGAYPVW